MIQKQVLRVVEIYKCSHTQMKRTKQKKKTKL